MQYFVTIFIFSSLLLTNPVCAYETDKIRKYDTIKSIAKRNIDRVRIKYGKNYKEYEKDIEEWNSKITDWQHPPVDQLIYVDYPYDHFLQGSRLVPSLGMYEDHDELNRIFSLSAFYASSFGSYKEFAIDQNISSGQNFPVTFGLGFGLTNEEKKHFILGSLYWAQAAKADVRGNSEAATSDFSIPGEIGVNLYYQYYLKQFTLGIYSGYDFEKLNTFNTSAIVTGSEIKNVDNKIHYGTFGLSKAFTLFDLNMNLKASYSKTVASTTSGEKALSGEKYILFYTYKPEGRFSFSTFYKHHNLTGSTKLTIERIGFSIGIFIL